MNDEVEIQPISVMKRNGKKYNKLLKPQAIRAHLNGAKFSDVSKQFGPCEDTIRKWVAAYLAGSLTLPGLEPVAPRALVKQAKVQSEESFVSLIGQHDSGNIELSFNRSGMTLDVKWPVSNAMECAQMLKELLK
jgi:hypothetical protein